MPKEFTKEELRQMKIEHLKWLRDHYKRMEHGSTPDEKIALKAQAFLLQKRKENA